MIAYDAWKELLRDERLPCAVVDLDAFDRNVAQFASFVESTGKSLRIATKSLRVPALWSRVLARGAPFAGLMCFSAAEVEWLAAQGHRDLLLAYPTVRAADLASLRAAHESGARVTLVVDSAAQLDRVAAAFSTSGKPFSVLVDVDASLGLLGGTVRLGVRRSPIRTADDVTKLLAHARRHPQLRVAGAMIYDAQIAGLGDRNPFKRLENPVASIVRKASLQALSGQREAILSALRAGGAGLEIVNGAGSGSVNLLAHAPGLTELTIGSGLLGPHLFDYYSNVRFEPACFFALQVVRSSGEGYVTCHGGGYVASGASGPDRLPRPWLPKGLSLTSLEGAGEVQTPLRVARGIGLETSDPVLFRHAKGGELAERFGEYLLVSNGRIVERAQTYRGLGCQFG